jgi:hypothetical protein
VRRGHRRRAQARACRPTTWRRRAAAHLLRCLLLVGLAGSEDLLHYGHRGRVVRHPLLLVPLLEVRAAAERHGRERLPVWAGVVPNPERAVLFYPHRGILGWSGPPLRQASGELLNFDCPRIADVGVCQSKSYTLLHSARGGTRHIPYNAQSKRWPGWSKIRKTKHALGVLFYPQLRILGCSGPSLWHRPVNCQE